MINQGIWEVSNTFRENEAVSVNESECPFKLNGILLKCVCPKIGYPLKPLFLFVTFHFKYPFWGTQFDALPKLSVGRKTSRCDPNIPRYIIIQDPFQAIDPHVRRNCRDYSRSCTLE